MDHPTLGRQVPFEAPPTGRPRMRDVIVDRAMAPGGDRASLRLPPADEALIAAAAARHDRVVVVIVGGSAVLVPWAETVPTVLITWYSGVEGGTALADVLTGAAEPAGRLPFAVPTAAEHLVPFDRDATAVVYDLFHGQWKLDRDGVPAQFPFGWGLGHGPVEVLSADLASDAATVRVTVGNPGPRPTSTVVFAFAGMPASVHDRPRRRLVGFSRVRVAPGATATADIAVDWSALDLRLDGGWVTEPGRYELEIGRHAHDPDALTVVVDRG
jgi:beta-glucosidase